MPKICVLEDVGRLYFFELVFDIQEEENFPLISYKIIFHEYYANATCSTHFCSGCLMMHKTLFLGTTYVFILATPVGHRVGEFAHDYVSALTHLLATKGIRNSYDSWHGRSTTKFHFELIWINFYST